jgi:lipid-A-disaccharide synthase
MSSSVHNNTLLIVTGETSGDILAAHLLQGLREQGCDLPVWGIGGPKLANLGMDCVETIDALAVRGYAEVLGSLPRLLALRRSLMTQAALRRPRLCITVDAPDFNLALAAKMKMLGIPTIHFISPSVWAWRRERLATIQQSVDTMLCVFPHEPALYHAVGMSAYYVGHPMAQSIPLTIDKINAKIRLLAIASKHALNSQARIVALLPGSRASELKYILPLQLAAAQLLSARDSHLHFVLPVASDALMAQAQTLLLAYPQLSITVLRGQAGLVLAGADIALIASGTATLEAALYRVPMVICYAMPHISWWMMRNKNYLPWVGLPNILCQDWLVPERLQEAASPQNLANDVWDLLNDAPRCTLIRQRFHNLHLSLKADTAALAARAVLRRLT